MKFSIKNLKKLVKEQKQMLLDTIFLRGWLTFDEAADLIDDTTNAVNRLNNVFKTIREKDNYCYCQLLDASNKGYFKIYREEILTGKKEIIDYFSRYEQEHCQSFYITKLDLHLFIRKQRELFEKNKFDAKVILYFGQ